MKVLLHDFPGHPFPVALSRELAQRGYEVLHWNAGGLQGPKGSLARSAEDAPDFRPRTIPLPGGFQKYNALSRLWTQYQYGSLIAQGIRWEKPDVVIGCTTPIDVERLMLRECRRMGIPYVHWVQDVYSLALDFYLKPKLGRLAKAVTAPFWAMEKWVARESDAAILISPDFYPLHRSWGVREERMHLLENWAPIEEVTPRDRMTGWRKELGLGDEFVFLYSGTLGLKHRPELIYALAEKMTGRAQVVVVSEGVGREALEKMPPLANLRLLDFVPYERVPEVLSSADVLLSAIEKDAAQFAVPSKVLYYLCTERPVLLSAPASNLASAVLERSGGGIGVAAEDTLGYLAQAERLLGNPLECRQLGLQGRAYAEKTFPIVRIADRFEEILGAAMRSRFVRPIAPPANVLPMSRSAKA